MLHRNKQEIATWPRRISIPLRMAAFTRCKAWVHGFPGASPPSPNVVVTLGK
jgi:hypothetical protein